VASPSLYGSCIRYSMPVCAGAPSPGPFSASGEEVTRNWLLRSGLADLEQYILEIVLDFGAGQSEEAKAAFLDESLPQAVPPDLACVNRPIDFESQLQRRAVEVEEEWADRVLAPELEAAHSPTAKSLPENAFASSLCLTEFSCAPDCLPVRRTVESDAVLH
jgi:hypothetical protein